MPVFNATPIGSVGDACAAGGEAERWSCPRHCVFDRGANTFGCCGDCDIHVNTFGPRADLTGRMKGHDHIATRRMAIAINDADLVECKIGAATAKTTAGIPRTSVVGARVQILVRER
jgi:hypothetical protein